MEQSCSMRTHKETDRQTDVHDEANIRFSQVWQRAYKYKNVKVHFWGEKRSLPYTTVWLLIFFLNVTVCVQDTTHWRSGVITCYLSHSCWPRKAAVPILPAFPQCGPLIELYILVTGKKPIWICYSVSKWVCYWYNIDQKKEKEMIWSEDIQFPMFYVFTLT
jgi:hypothetical protein